MNCHVDQFALYLFTLTCVVDENVELLLSRQELFGELSNRFQEGQVQLQDLDLASVAAGARDDVPRRRDAFGFAAAAQVDPGATFGQLDGGLEADT